MERTQGTEQSNRGEGIEHAMNDIGSIGKVWARYGLLAGKSALETSAVTLGKVAGLLDRMATMFKEEQEAAEQVGEERDSDSDQAQVIAGEADQNQR